MFPHSTISCSNEATQGRAEVGSLRTQLAELKKSVIVEISDATAQMNNEILSMQFKMKTQLSDSESNNVDLRESVSQMQSELEEAQISIANLQQSLATREEELASKNRESSQLQSSLQTKDSEIAALRDGIEGLKNEIKERVEEITFLRRDVAESNQSKLALREEVTVLKAKLEASEMSFESTQRELEETKSELHKLAEVSNRGEEESTAATSPDEEDQSLSGRERGYVADIKVLETKLQKNQEELAASKTDAASLRKELASIKSEASKVERSMEDLRVNYETALSEMSALQAANAMAASDARIAKGELESMISAYEDETKKVEELSEQLAALKRTENEKETIAAKQAQEIETLERKVAALEAEIENIAMRRVKEVEEVECARTKLETALADKKTLLSEKLDELSLVITERDRLQEECALRKKEVDDLTERADNLQREVDQVQQVMEQGLLQASDVVARIDRVNATPLEVAPTEEAIDEETTALINRLEDEVARLKEQVCPRIYLGNDEADLTPCPWPLLKTAAPVPPSFAHSCVFINLLYLNCVSFVLSGSVRKLIILLSFCSFSCRPPPSSFFFGSLFNFSLCTDTNSGAVEIEGKGSTYSWQERLDLRTARRRI